MREAGEKNSQAIEYAAGQCHDSRSFAVQPQTTEERSNAQDKNADRKRQRYFRNAPTELLRKRNTENAPGIDGTQRNLEEDTCDCDYPSIISSHKFLLMISNLYRCLFFGGPPMTVA